MDREQKKAGRPRTGRARSAAERMRTYRARKRAAGLKSVVAWKPVIEAETEVFSDHRLLDARSLALHAVIARKILRNPDLLAIARRNIERWRSQRSDPLPDYFTEWSRILNRPCAEIAAFLTSLSEDAVRLRQSTPFAGVLTAAERKRIYDAFRA